MCFTAIDARLRLSLSYVELSCPAFREEASRSLRSFFFVTDTTTMRFFAFFSVSNESFLCPIDGPVAFLCDRRLYVARAPQIRVDGTATSG